MDQISKRLTIAGAFLSLVCGFLLTQQPAKAANTSQEATPTTQVVKANSNVLDQGVDGTCKWDLVKDGDEGVLTIHAGQLNPGALSSVIDHSNVNNTGKVNKIVIDPGVIAPKDSSSLFYYFFNAKEFVGLSNLDTSQVTNMTSMFYNCGVKELDLSNWDTSQVNNMSEMFARCGVKELDLSNWDTANVIYMSGMFDECKKLEKVNTQSFNTENVKYMQRMFFSCRNLRKIDISNFYTPNLINAELIFGEDYLDYVDMRNFDSSKIDGSLDVFEIAYICKLTVGSKFTNQYFPQTLTGQIFDDNGIKKVVTSQTWITLNGPEKGVKKSAWEMTNVKRDQPVTYILENKILINPYLEYKTVTRTIKIHSNIDNVDEPVIFTQKATIHRQVTINDNGTKTYGEWSKDYWDEYNAPAMNNGDLPRPSKVDKQIVDGNTQDQTVDIYY